MLLYLNKSAQECESHTYIELIQNNKNIKDEELQKICNELKQCFNLETLKLNLFQNKITTKGVTYLTSVWKTLKNLKILNLNLQNNSFSDQGVIELGGGLEHLFQLEDLELEITNTNLSQKGIQKLFISIGKCKNLKRLDLHCGYNVQNGIGVAIQKAFEKLLNLKIFLLDIYESMLDDNDINSICKTIQKCKKLEVLSLNLQGNFIGKKGASNVAQCVSSFKQLKKVCLLLDGNQFESDGLQDIGKSLIKCPDIQEIKLDLYGNEIHDKGFLDFSKSLAKCSSLQIIDLFLGRNHITSKGICIFFQQIAQCKNLREMIIGLSPQDLDEIALENLNKLIGNNQLIKIELSFRGIEQLSKQQSDVIYNALKNNKLLNSVTIDVIGFKNTCKLYQDIKRKMHRLVKFGRQYW